MTHILGLGTLTFEERREARNPELSTKIREAAKQLIQLLPPQERAAVVLKDVFDLQVDEIAAILQTTAGAIKTALHRGRNKLATPNTTRVFSRASAALLDVWYAALADPSIRAVREVFSHRIGRG